MPKQTITINVPDDKEIDWDMVKRNNSETPLSIYVIYFKDREYIEVREYLNNSFRGVLHHSAQKGLSDIKKIEEGTDFIRWIDQDWRKVEI